MNTNDPDYEHIYSIETYDDDAPIVDTVDYDTTFNKSQGMLDFECLNSLRKVCGCIWGHSLMYKRQMIFWQAKQSLRIH